MKLAVIKLFSVALCRGSPSSVELLLSRLADKGLKLQQALVLVQFLRHCDEVMFWIHDKEAFVTSDEFGHDLEHVEVLQRKFDEFQKDMASQEYRVTEVNELADKLLLDGHPSAIPFCAGKRN